MPQARPLSVNHRNLIWMTVIALAAVVGWIVGGWQIAAGAAIVLLVVSELVERLARRSRQQLPASTADAV